MSAITSATKWHLEEYEGEPGRLVVDESGCLIADCSAPSHAGHGVPADYQANARAIAAIPEALAALKAAEDFMQGFEDGHPDDCPDALGLCRGAIRSMTTEVSELPSEQPLNVNRTARDMLTLTASAVDAWDNVKASALVEAAAHIADPQHEAKLNELYESIGNDNGHSLALIGELLETIK